MKNQFNQALFTALLMTGAFAVQAQKTPGNPPPPPELAAGKPGKPMPPPPGGKPGMPKPSQELTKLTTLTGNVGAAISNDRFEYNGFTLSTGSSSVNVMYPPHLGEQIFNKAKNSTNVKVTGFYKTNPEGKNEFRLVNMDVNGTTITEVPPTPPTSPPVQEQKTVNSTIKELRYSPKKDVNGIILSSGEMVGFPPHIAQQLGTQLKTGEKVSVTGFLEPKRPGVVYSQNVVLIKAQTLTLNGQAYLVR